MSDNNINFVDGNEQNLSTELSNDILKVKKYKSLNNKKNKIKRTFTKVTSIGLGLALLIGGSIHYINKKSEKEINSNYTYSDYSNYTNQNSYVDDKIAFEIIKGEDPIVEKSITNSSINLNISDYNEFINYVNSLDFNYKYEELYDINEAINKHSSNKNTNHSHDITNGTNVLTSELLYNRVKMNNEIFFDDQNKSSGYKKIKNSYIKDICELLVNSINSELNNNQNINKKDVYCILYDLKIVGKNVTFNNASYDENDVLVVDKDNIENYQFFNNDVDAFRQIIYHEAMHIIQSVCNDKEDIGKLELGICYKYDDLKVNPLYWSWFLEAAAEKEMGKILGEDTHTYSAPIGYYDSLILCSILNENVSVSDVESLSFEKKADSLFKAFNATTNEEKMEIIKMMYSIEIMQSKPEDFYKVYKEKYGVDLSNDTNELENLRLSLRIDILKTLSKEFYKSLSSQVSKGNVSLDTVFYLINVYESDVFIHLFYNEKDRIASGVEFFDFYTELQNKFFEMLSISTDYNFDEIVDLFNNYSMNVSYEGKVIKNYNLDKLGDDAIFIEKKRSQNYQTGIPTIRSMPEYCVNNGYKK